MTEEDEYEKQIDKILAKIPNCECHKQKERLFKLKENQLEDVKDV